MGVQKKASERKKATSCESCTFYAWDDEYEYYVCEADLDEDEMSSFLYGTDFSCPSFTSQTRSMFSARLWERASRVFFLV